MANPISIPKGYRRLGDFPLDPSAIFNSHFALTDYAANNGTAYNGQLCSVTSGEDEGVYVLSHVPIPVELGAGPVALVFGTEEARDIYMAGDTAAPGQLFQLGAPNGLLFKITETFELQNLGSYPVSEFLTFATYELFVEHVETTGTLGQLCIVGTAESHQIYSVGRELYPKRLFGGGSGQSGKVLTNWPATGTHVLAVVDGNMQWIATEEC